MPKNIEPQLKKISEYLKTEKDEIFVVPPYQRSYCWEKEQCAKLLDDVHSFIQDNNNDPYFFGTIIVDRSNDKRFQLIDGQQRTITFLLLLKALQLRLKETLKTFGAKNKKAKALKSSLQQKEDQILTILYKPTSGMELYDIKTDWSRVKNVSCLENQSNQEEYPNDLQKIINIENFSDYIPTQIPHKQKENRYTNFFKNFKYFYEQLSSTNLPDVSYLDTFAQNFLDKCQIIEIKSWQIEQAITMFNSLNSTGQPLSDSDIISAQLYSHLDNDDRNQFKEIWQNLKASMNSSEEIIDIDSVLQQYMYILRAENENTDKKDPDYLRTPGVRKFYTQIYPDLLKKPMELCGKFQKITDIWNKVSEHSITKLLLKFNDNIKLYIISFLNRYDSDDIDEDKFLIIAECLIRLFSILEVVDAPYSSKQFKTFLFNENKKLVDKNCTLTEIKKDFDEHISKNWKKEDLNSLLNEYSSQHTALVFLNEYLYAKEKGKDFNLQGSVNIEHIMPDSGKNLDEIRQDAKIKDEDEFNVYKNKLGNRILLEENINKSLSNEWFRSKKSASPTKKLIDEATKTASDRILNFIFNKK